MKRIIISVAIIFCAVLTSNAQFFVAGSVGMDFTSGKYKSGNVTTDRPSTFTFEVWPAARYFLSDRFAIGLETGIERSVTDQKNNSKSKTIETTWGIAAFGIYKLIEVNNLGLLLKGSLEFQSSKDKYKTGSTSSDGDPTKMIGVFVLPVLSYSLTDRISVEAYSDFLQLGFGNYSYKSGSTKTTGNYFGLGANYDSGMNNAVSFGIVYKF